MVNADSYKIYDLDDTNLDTDIGANFNLISFDQENNSVAYSPRLSVNLQRQNIVVGENQPVTYLTLKSGDETISISPLDGEMGFSFTSINNANYTLTVDLSHILTATDQAATLNTLVHFEGMRLLSNIRVGSRKSTIFLSDANNDGVTIHYGNDRIFNKDLSATATALDAESLPGRVTFNFKINNRVSNRLYKFGFENIQTTQLTIA